jgi:hypothetical protein
VAVGGADKVRGQAKANARPAGQQRQPLEDGKLTLSRTGASFAYLVPCTTVAILCSRRSLLLLPASTDSNEGALHSCAIT